MGAVLNTSCAGVRQVLDAAQEVALESRGIELAPEGVREVVALRLPGGSAREPGASDVLGEAMEEHHS